MTRKQQRVEKTKKNAAAMRELGYVRKGRVWQRPQSESDRPMRATFRKPRT